MDEWPYPKVLINPQVEPSAYREHTSPIWRKLDILSDMAISAITVTSA